MWFEQMHAGWQAALLELKPQLAQLESATSKLSSLAPRADLVMASFRGNPDDVRVVILGQDPYPTPAVAIGHAFAVNRSSTVPASLKNIQTELKADLDLPIRDFELQSWREQGVWLLNTCLTTLEFQPGAHSKIGWQPITEAALTFLANRQPLVILAWGKPAQAVAKRVQTEQTRIIDSAHPSPLSARRGFFGSRPFSRANNALRELGLQTIDW